MIDEWLLGVEELLVRTPGGLARWGDASYELAKLRRVFFEGIQSEDDVAKLRPFFIVQEHALAFTREGESGESLQPEGGVEVLYTEMFSDPSDRKASKQSFTKFVGDMVTSIGDRQGKPIAGNDLTSYVPVSGISFVQLPAFGIVAHEDPDVPGTMYFSTTFVLTIG